MVIPKSTKKERIVDNADVYDFVLSPADVESMTKLDEFLITVSTAGVEQFCSLISRIGLGSDDDSLK